MRNKSSGFTLLELMIVVAVIGILSAIALPSYKDYITRGHLTEAYNTLSAMRVAAEQYYQDNRTYVGWACSPASAGSASSRFTFSCGTTLSAVAYTITATGIAAQGTGGFTFTINQDNAKSTTTLSTGASAGWTANATCWIRKKTGEC